MALLTGSGDSYTLSGGVGKGRHFREDLADFITNISPTETPMLSGIGKVKAKGVTHEWLTHSLAAAAADNVVVEGNDISSFSTPTTLTRVTNVCQINQKNVAISGTVDAVDKAGMGRELAYRVMLHTKEIKRDIETAILQNTQSVTGSTTVARRANGVAGFVTTNTTTITTALTASDINAILQDCWDEGGDPNVLIGNGLTKRLVSGLAGSTSTSYQWNMEADQKKFATSVDIWDGDFGVQRIIPDRFDATDTVKAIQMDLWKWAELRPLKVEPLAKTGDADKRLLTCEATLECRAENANGILTHAGS